MTAHTLSERRRSMPFQHRVEPMLAETGKEPFDSKDWLFELKLDGVRCIAYLDNETTRLQARSGADITRKFPELQNLHQQAVAKPCILDGEIVCDSFAKMQERIHKERTLDIKIASRHNPATFHAFDILYLKGESLSGKALEQRKCTLALYFRGSVIPFQTEYGTSLFERVRQNGSEGIMAKRLTSTYQQGRRSPDWLKIKNFHEDKFIILGMTEGENERASTFGSLILGREDKAGFTYVGNVGSGFNNELLQRLSLVLPQIKGNCPFAEVPDIGRELKCWVMPFLWCEIRFLEYGSDGKLRFPTFRKLASGC